MRSPVTLADRRSLTTRRRSESGTVAVALALLLLAAGWAGLVVLHAGPGASGTSPPSVAGPRSVTPRLEPTGVRVVPSTVPRVAIVNVGALPPYRASAGTGAGPVAGEPPAVRDRPVLRPVPSLGAPVTALSIAASNLSGPVPVLRSAEGINADQCGCAPPDVQLGVSPTAEVELVNLEGTVFNGTGVAERSFSLSTFFSAGSDFLSDPKIIYDNATQRWFASILDVSSTPAGYTRVAVSTSGDPNGTWYVYRIAMPSGTFGDQPILGIGSRTIAVSGDIFGLSGTTYDGSAFWVLNKSEAMNGTTPLSVAQYGPDGSTYSMHPVDSVSPSPDLFVVMTNYAGTTSSIELFDVAGVPPDALQVTVTNLTVATVNPAPSAVQQGSGDALDTGDSRVQSAIWSRGLLWLTFSDQCQLPTDTVARSCARLVELNTSALGVVQDFDVSLGGAYLYYPALAEAPDGRLVLILGVASSTMYPGLLLTGRLPGDPASTLDAASWLIQGTQADACGSSVCRYGDYFGGAWVPDTSMAWLAGEYGGSSSAWQSRLGETRLSGPLGLVLSARPTAFEAGQSTNVTITLLNASCGGGVYCTVHVPLGATAFDRSCVDQFTSATVTLTEPAAGNWTVGAGGWAATYSTAGCAPAAETANVSASTVDLHVAALLAVTVVATPAGTADVGQPIQFLGTTSGGALPYAYAWSGLPAGCLALNASSIACSPTAAGAATVRLDVGDGYGVQASGTLQYWIDPALSAAASVTPATIDLGGRVALAAQASGGSESYHYAWNGLPSGCAGGDQPAFSCQPTASGTFPVNVTVSDSNGGTVTSADVLLQVLPPFGVTLAVSGPTRLAGEPLALWANVTGGQAPFAYVWVGLPAGCTGGNRSTFTCAPTSLGSFKVNVTVTDALGTAASATVAFTILSAPASSPTGSTWLPVLVVAGAAAIAVAWVARRRRKRATR
jgi:hypothetical protein